jgi:hypothetical protein
MICSSDRDPSDHRRAVLRAEASPVPFGSRWRRDVDLLNDMES